MTRQVVTAISMIVATISGSYAASLLAAKYDKGTSVAKEVPSELVKLEIVVVPVIRKGAVQGYVIARAEIAVGADDAKAMKPLLQSYAAEAAFKVLFEKGVDFGALKPLEVTEIANQITGQANQRIGRNLIKTTVIESINFVPQGEVRELSTRKK
jgi:hypothetical protein